ncbi:unnamed protein product, partial [Sphacelaria rigidula]
MELFRGGREGKGGRKVDDVMGIAADNRVTLSLVYVVSLALKHIKAQIIDRLNSSGQGTLRSSDIRFVLTIPAIWSEFGKIFMRTAAFRGGLIDSEHDQENLALCLEPEAACLSVEQDNAHPWEQGTQVMVLDCGGGTIDVTTHEVIGASPLELKEVEEPTGGPWGSTVVDSKFKAFLKDILRCSKEAWDKLSGSTQMLSLMRDWESKKTDYQEGQSVRLQLGDILDQIEMNVITFKVSVEDFNSTVVGATGRTLKIEPALMSSFFEDVLYEIVRVSREVLDKNPGISMVYLVGGFSSSPLLQKAVTTGLKNGHGAVRVIAPRRPGLAIVLGAALFGANKGSIISRRARLTYGTAILLRYNAADPEHSKRESQTESREGKIYLDTFYKYVERGQDLPVGTEKEHTFWPVTEGQQSMRFEVLVTKQCAADVQYVKDRGVNRMLNNLVTVDVPIDMTASFTRRHVSMRFSFGGSELGIKCKRHSDGKEVRV